MTIYAALARAVNVGGRNRLAMEDWRQILRRLGYGRVRSYVQSGNAVFEAADRPTEAVAGAIEAALADALGLKVRVLVRSAGELAGVARANPFVGDAADPRQLHVTFLADPPVDGRLAALPAAQGSDRFEARGREVYLLLPGGYGATRLHSGWFERLLAVPATTRSWATVCALEAMCRET